MEAYHRGYTQPSGHIPRLQTYVPVLELERNNYFLLQLVLPVSSVTAVVAALEAAGHRAYILYVLHSCSPVHLDPRSPIPNPLRIHPRVLLGVAILHLYDFNTNPVSHFGGSAQNIRAEATAYCPKIGSTRIYMTDLYYALQ